MTHIPSPPAMRLHGPTGLVAAVPSLLGFHPTESLVLLCLAGPRGRVGPIARVDLEGPFDVVGLARQLLGYAVRYAESAAVVCYTDSVGRPKLLDAVVSALDGAGVPLLDVLTVRDGVIRHAATQDEESTDRGLPVPGPDDSQVMAMRAVRVCEGRSVLPDRKALARSISAPEGDALEDARLAVLGWGEELARVAAGLAVEQIDDELTHRALRALTRARRELRQCGRVAGGTATELSVLLTSVPVRDAVIARVVSRYDDGWVPTLISVATHCPPEEAAPTCAVLAAAAYRYGDGALAQVALDRCLAAEPEHRLAHLLLSIMAAGIPPDELAGLAQAGLPPRSGPTPERGNGRGREVGAERTVSPGTARRRRPR